MYLDLLHEKIHHRLEELQLARRPPRNIWCPARARCSRPCRRAGLKLYLASGTDQDYMREEARLLDVDRYFDGGVYGALDDYKSFSKKILIQQADRDGRVPRRRVPGLRRRLRRDREREGSRRRGGGRRHRRAGMPGGRRVEAPAPGRRGRGLHHSQFPLPSANCCTRCSPMGSKYELFDRSRLRDQAAGRARARPAPRSLAGARRSPAPPFSHPQLAEVAPRAIARAAAGAARILMMGAHVLRAGVNRHDHRPDGARLHRPHRHERRRRHPRLRTGAHRRHHRKRGALHPHRRVRPVARDRRAERLDLRGRARWASAWARTSAGASTPAISRTATSASWPRPTGARCP